MSSLAISAISLISALRTAPLNGAASSLEYNQTSRENLTDLGTLASFINNTLLPLLTTLDASASQYGIEGRTILGDTTDTSVLFYNTLQSKPISVADSIRVVYGMVQTAVTQAQALTAQVGQLSSQFSTNNLLNISQSLGGLTNSLSQIQIQVASLTIQSTANTVLLGQISSVYSNNRYKGIIPVTLNPVSISTPGAVTDTPNSTGGTLSPGTYTVSIAAVNSYGNSTAAGTAKAITILSTPAAPTGTSYTTGGSLPAGTYTIGITALYSNGASTPVSTTTNFTTTGSTGSIVLNWSAVTGVSSYNVWLSTGQYFNTTSLTYTLTSPTGTTGTVPVIGANLNSIALSWTPVTNAVSYNVWLSTGEYFTTSTASYTLTSGTGISGTVPTTNNTLSTVIPVVLSFTTMPSINYGVSINMETPSSISTPLVQQLSYWSRTSTSSITVYITSSSTTSATVNMHLTVEAII